MKNVILILSLFVSVIVNAQDWVVVKEMKNEEHPHRYTDSMNTYDAFWWRVERSVKVDALGVYTYIVRAHSSSLITKYKGNKRKSQESTTVIEQPRIFLHFKDSHRRKMLSFADSTGVIEIGSEYWNPIAFSYYKDSTLKDCYFNFKDFYANTIE